MMRTSLPIGLNNGDWVMPISNPMMRPTWEWGNQLQGTKSLSSMGCMVMDAVETEDTFKVYCECPGIPKEEIDVKIENNMLTIKGTKAKMYI